VEKPVGLKSLYNIDYQFINSFFLKNPNMKLKTYHLKIYCFLFIFCIHFIPLASQTFDKNEFARRRSLLMQKMDGGIAIFKSAEVVNRNYDIDYKFRQESDFYYLTGFDEPGSAFLLIPGADKEFIMFVRPGNTYMEIWTGKNPGIEEVMNIFGADTVFAIDRFDELLPIYVEGKDKVYCSVLDKKLTGKILALMEPRPGDHLKHISKPPKTLIDPLPVIHEMRVIKSDYEIQLIKKPINITCDAQIEAMKAARPGMYEYEIEAIIEYIYRKNGCPRYAFPSIVGSGPNTAVLHHMRNDRKIRDGDLILIDIGAEDNYYAADITRTIPANGKFSKEQKEIYEIVLNAQKEAIMMIKPGVSFTELEDKVIAVVKDGLYKLGLILDKNSEWQYKVWYYTYPWHYLGIDVHDVGRYVYESSFLARNFEAGMVVTMEPGIYISRSMMEIVKDREWFATDFPEDEVKAFFEKVQPVAEKYFDLGIRIEDDILVTKDGHEVLSAKAPKEIKDIEEMMKNKSIFYE
jgi:Xaa-Pro aminopeptidase